jgi:hypothetical protein
MKEKVKIYWSPDTFDKELDWNVLYYTPTFLHDELMKNKIKDIPKNNNLFICPAVRDLTSKIMVIKNTLHSHYKIKQKEDSSYEFEVLSKNHITLLFPHVPNLKNCILISYSLPFLLYSEEDITMTLTSPYFSNSPHLMYGSIVPGKFNISKWFRPLNLEFNLWPGIDEFKIKKEEDIAYVHFDTEKEIELVRFDMTERIKKISLTLGTSGRWEKMIPLQERYQRFKRSQINKILINEIKKNIVE